MTCKEVNTIMTKNLLGIRCYEVTTLMQDHGVSLDTLYSLRALTRDQGEALVKRFNATSDLLHRWRVAALTAAWPPRLRPAQQQQLQLPQGLVVATRPPSITSNHRTSLRRYMTTA
ncbi:TPA: hypothetical protein ACH3X1_006720 [Trebouxia sp. C0004]